MRGDDQQQSHMFSYLPPEARVRKDHPLRAVRGMVDKVLKAIVCANPSNCGLTAGDPGFLDKLKGETQ